MKSASPEDYYEFFLELPPADYLTDIEIQDEYEKPNDSAFHGLSDEQVSQIALDSLSSARLSPLRPRPVQDNTDEDVSPPLD
jgi:hypothetical protein